MDFFILFAAMGLVALSRITVGLGGMPKADLAAAAPCGAMDWAAVRAQIFGALGAEAVASRALRTAVTQRAVAKSHRRWVAKAAAAEGRAKALSTAKAARLAARTAAKAAQRAKSAAVAERYGHAAQRAAAAIRAARKAAAVGVVPLAGYGIKAQKRATRGSTSAQLAAVRAARVVAAQQRNAAARAAADAANAAFAARMTAKQAARKAAEKAAAEGRTRRAALADLLAKRDAVRLAHAVTRAGAKAEAKEGFVQWLDENGHHARGEAYVAANEAAWTAAKAKEGYQAHFGFSPEVVVAADKAAYERRALQRALRKAAKAARNGKAVAA